MVLNMGSNDNIQETGGSQDIINILSDLEEGEINEASDLDEVSDVSTEEELLLRQRITILENYNSALGKKEARLRRSGKDKNVGAKTSRPKVTQNARVSPPPLANLIVIDDVDDEIPYAVFKKTRNKIKTPKRHKRPHSHKYLSKKIAKTSTKPASEDAKSSGESDYEKIRRRKRILREAVGISKAKIDHSSLKKRLLHIMKGSHSTPNNEKEIMNIMKDGEQISENKSEANNKKISQNNKIRGAIPNITVDLTAEEITEINDAEKSTSLMTDELDGNKVKNLKELVNLDKNNCTSDDEAETLRQLALNSKSIRKNMNPPPVTECPASTPNSKIEEIKVDDSSDSDTAELRMIALKSAMLKKAIERKKLKKDTKRKHLKRKRKSLSNIFSDDGFDNIDLSYLSNDNNTDVETIDMDIDMEPCKSPAIESGFPNTFEMYTQSDNPFPQRNVHNGLPQDILEDQNYQYLFNDFQYYDSNNYIHKPMKSNESYPINISDKIDENVEEGVEDLEEDEDILRAKLLHSISKSHSKEFSEKATELTLSTPNKLDQSSSVKVWEQSDSGLIIKLGDSDSGSECETTKNLTLMHKKLTQQNEFQRNLDMYLKSARSKFESSSPVIVEQNENSLAKKHTPMAVRHLPKADQQEYRQLVKRMSELEKVRNARQMMLQKTIGTGQNNFTITLTRPHSADTEKNPSSMENIRKVESPSVLKGNGMVSGRSLQIVKSTTGPSGLDIQLDMSRQKISNQMKVVEQLQSEGKGLREKTESLAAQLRAVNTALRGSRIALNNNQRTLHTAHRNLVRFRKQHHILLNRIKNSPLSKVNNNLAITIKQNVNTNIDNSKVKSVTVMDDGALITKNYHTVLKTTGGVQQKNLQAIENSTIAGVKLNFPKINCLTTANSELRTENNLAISTAENICPKSFFNQQNNSLRTSLESSVLTATGEICNSNDLNNSIIFNAGKIPASKLDSVTNGGNLIPKIKKEFQKGNPPQSILDTVIQYQNLKSGIEKCTNDFSNQQDSAKLPEDVILQTLANNLFDLSKDSKTISDSHTREAENTKAVSGNSEDNKEQPSLAEKENLRPGNISSVTNEQELNCRNHITSQPEDHIQLGKMVSDNKLLVETENEGTNKVNKNYILDISDAQSSCGNVPITVNVSSANTYASVKDAEVCDNNLPGSVLMETMGSGPCIELNSLDKDRSKERDAENSTKQNLPNAIDHSKPSSLLNILLEHSNKDKCIYSMEVANREYKSPLQVLKTKNNWSEDAQAIFCPFEVGGSCMDPECKYFHPRP